MKTIDTWDLYKNQCEITQLMWKTLVAVVVSDEMDQITFVTQGGQQFVMYHDQDCCETVSIESISGDLSDLIGTPILLAEESTSGELPEGHPAPDGFRDDSETWTFYKLATSRGYVDIRWYGSSNGYYSESVNFALLPSVN